jgi:hypothetical protein
MNKVQEKSIFTKTVYLVETVAFVLIGFAGGYYMSLGFLVSVIIIWGIFFPKMINASWREIVPSLILVTSGWYLGAAKSGIYYIDNISPYWLLLMALVTIAMSVFLCAVMSRKKKTCSC